MANMIAVCICNKQEEYLNQFKHCKGCKLNRYCSKECYKKDWPRHKLECQKIIGEEQLKFHNWVNDMCKRSTKTRVQKIVKYATEFCIEQGSATDQQIIICDVNMEKFELKFYVVLNHEMEKCPAAYKHHIEKCPDKMLIFVQNEECKVMIVLQTEKVTEFKRPPEEEPCDFIVTIT
jgi:hypothetical protein